MTRALDMAFAMLMARLLGRTGGRYISPPSSLLVRRVHIVAATLPRARWRATARRAIATLLNTALLRIGWRGGIPVLIAFWLCSSCLAQRLAPDTLWAIACCTWPPAGQPGDRPDRLFYPTKS